MGLNQMKTRVAIVLPYFGTGGAENMVSRLAANLDLNQIEPEVICIYGMPQNNILEQKVLEHSIPIKYIGKGIGFSVHAMLKLGQELTSFKPDVIHTHLAAGPYCALWAWIHSTIILHTVHNMPQYEFGRIKRMVMKILYQHGKAVPIAISHEIQQMVYKAYKVRRDVELIYNPVDVQRFVRTGKRTASHFTIVSVGRLSKQKNQQLLLDAFRILLQSVPDARLYILGDGPLKEELYSTAESMGISENVSFKGNVSNVEVYYAKADVFALSSVYEGLPLVVLEAMAAGLPIVSTDVGGVKDIVTNNGILVPNLEPTAFANALLLLYKDAHKRQEMGKSSSLNVQKFDSNIIAKQYAELYTRYGKQCKTC